MCLTIVWLKTVVFVDVDWLAEVIEVSVFFTFNAFVQIARIRGQRQFSCQLVNLVTSNPRVYTSMLWMCRKSDRNIIAKPMCHLDRIQFEHAEITYRRLHCGYTGSMRSIADLNFPMPCKLFGCVAAYFHTRLAHIVLVC